MQLISEIGNRLWFWDTANFLEQTLTKYFLFLGVVEHERFRFEIEHLVLLRLIFVFILLLHIDDASLLQVFEVHIGVSQFFLGVLKGAVKVSFGFMSVFFELGK